MKGNPQIIALLNEVLTGELTAINQYFLHSRICGNWGYERLCKKIKDESIDEMKHADWLIERILYLEGLPNLQKLDKINVGQTVVEILASDYALEKSAIPRLNAGIRQCADAGDNGSRELLERILVSEERHANWLEEQHTLVQQVGEQNYLAEQIKKES